MNAPRRRKRTQVLDRLDLMDYTQYTECGYIVWKDELAQENHFELGSDVVLIGRADDAQIVFDHVSVSRHHAQIVFKNEQYYLEDLNSTNGVFINGVRVASSVLRNNDQIDIGKVRISYTEKRTKGL